MFAGVIEKKGRVLKVGTESQMRRVLIEKPRTWKLVLGQSINIDGVWKPISKDPVGDPSKKSKPGRLCLYGDGTRYFTTGAMHGLSDCMHTVFEDGKLGREWSFEEVRAAANACLEGRLVR